MNKLHDTFLTHSLQIKAPIFKETFVGHPENSGLVFEHVEKFSF
jgi:hypothetical protein